MNDSLSIEERIAGLQGILDDLRERSNCSCHINPPCYGCVEEGGLEKQIDDLKDQQKREAKLEPIYRVKPRVSSALAMGMLMGASLSTQGSSQRFPSLRGKGPAAPDKKKARKAKQKARRRQR